MSMCSTSGSKWDHGIQNLAHKIYHLQGYVLYMQFLLSIFFFLLPSITCMLWILLWVSGGKFTISLFWLFLKILLETLIHPIYNFEPVHIENKCVFSLLLARREQFLFSKEIVISGKLVLELALFWPSTDYNFFFTTKGFMRLSMYKRLHKLQEGNGSFFFSSYLYFTSVKVS